MLNKDLRKSVTDALLAGDSVTEVSHRSGGHLVGCRFLKAKGKWEARIAIDYIGTSLGRYDTEQEASDTYFKVIELLNKGLSREEIQKAFGVTPRRNRQFKGTTYDKRNKSWVAYIYINSKRKHLGYFKTQELAYEAVLKEKGEL